MTYVDHHQDEPFVEHVVLSPYASERLTVVGERGPERLQWIEVPPPDPRSHRHRPAGGTLVALAAVALAVAVVAVEVVTGGGVSAVLDGIRHALDGAGGAGR